MIKQKEEETKHVKKHQQLVVSGTNVVAMARHGLILWENGATGLRIIFKCLPGLRDTTMTPA